MNTIWNFGKHFLKSQTNFEKSEHILDIENSSSNSKIVHQILKSSLVFKKSSLNLKKSSSILKKVHGIWLEKFIDFAENVHAFCRKEKMNKTVPIKKEKEKTVPKTKKKKTIPANKKRL